MRGEFRIFKNRQEKGKRKGRRGNLLEEEEKVERCRSVSGLERKWEGKEKEGKKRGWRR